MVRDGTGSPCAGAVNRPQRVDGGLNGSRSRFRRCSSTASATTDHGTSDEVGLMTRLPVKKSVRARPRAIGFGSTRWPPDAGAEIHGPGRQCSRWWAFRTLQPRSRSSPTLRARTRRPGRGHG